MVECGLFDDCNSNSSVISRYKKEKGTHNGRFRMCELCAQSANMFHPWNLIRSHTESRDCCNCCLQLDTPSSLAES